MKKYKIRVTRILYENAIIEVKADSEEEAQRKAIELAANDDETSRSFNLDVGECDYEAETIE